jgi:hypothetical protein
VQTVSPPLTTAGRLVEAVAAQDFSAVRDCFTDAVRFRALLPRGPVETTGPEAATDRFRGWFGEPDDLEVVDAAISTIAGKACLRWRLRLTTPTGAARLVEQHLFVSGDGRLDAVDLLCSGWMHGGAR